MVSAFKNSVLFVHYSLRRNMKASTMASMSLGYVAALALCTCMVYYGSVALGDCPSEPKLPIYLISKSIVKKNIKIYYAFYREPL